MTRTAIAFSILLVIGLGFWVLGQFGRERAGPVQDQTEPTALVSSTHEGGQRREKSRRTVHPKVSGDPRRFTREEHWKHFKDGFGADLQADFLPDGRLAAIRGGGASRPANSYRSGAREDAERRAREIVAGAADLLGLERELPIGDASVTADESSAQVHLQESYEGVPVAPYGTVSVRLGAHGELLGLDSTYVPGVRPANSRSRSPGGGRMVLWLSSPSAGALARWGIESYQEGRQIVVDAETGTTLFKRDRRQF